MSQEIAFLRRKIQPGALAVMWISIVIGLAIAISPTAFLRFCLAIMLGLMALGWHVLQKRGLLFELVNVNEMNPPVLIDKILFTQIFVSLLCFFFVAFIEPDLASIGLIFLSLNLCVTVSIESIRKVI